MGWRCGIERDSSMLRALDAPKYWLRTLTVA
jgi:hypothetical protein